MWKLLGQLLEGTVVSLEVFTLTLVFAIPLALPVALGRMSRNPFVRAPVNLYIQVMRGTPLILQIIFVYFAPYYVLGLSWGEHRLAAVIVAFAVNYAAYFAEIYRGGIQSIPKGQWEAAKVLGFTRADAFFRVIVPQVVKRILPASANEVITLVKDTALAQVVGLAELFRVAQNASARQFSTTPIFVAGAFYFVMNWVVSEFFVRWERRLEYY
ncbi:MAG TPA: amino acid ABC transporter permease [Anaeromyxobacter sp.]|nr:amino acid ABC transporter permease [Anaeromyxobacter sp.]